MTWGSSDRLEMTMDLLTPKIADITDEGLSLSGDVTAEEMGLSEADAVVQGPLAVGLDLRKVESTICITGVVEGTAVRQCVRCLKEFDEPIAFAVRAAYEREVKPAPAGPKREDHRKKHAPPIVEAEVEEPNDDIYHYAGDHLDLAPMLREQVILAAPMHPLCRDECLGLCPRCGKDLNEGPCQCPADSRGGPFEVLKTLKPKKDWAKKD
jgi:uncharacterized protein